MVIQEKCAKSILTKSKLPQSDYCINPYIGCMHACVYCYARYMKRFTAHEEPWGEFVDVKVNAPALLHHTKMPLSSHDTILLGSVTDAYQPLERKYKITRSILEQLVPSNATISILTKSNIILRDLDLLKQFQRIQVGVTFTTMDDAVRKVIEPRTASVEQRIQVCKELHEHGIFTYAFIGPILPGLTDLPALFEALHPYVDEVWGEILNTKGGIDASMLSCYEKYFPNALSTYQMCRKNPAYWDEMEHHFHALCQQYNLPSAGFYRH